MNFGLSFVDLVQEKTLLSILVMQSDSDGKRLKSAGSGDDNQNQKAGGETNSGKEAEQNNKPASEPPKDYIHVRARRGQATDSHSLAERVFFKLLQLSKIYE